MPRNIWQVAQGNFWQLFYKYGELFLVEELFCNKTLSSGTIRVGRRGFPKELFDKKLKQLARGDVIGMRKGPMMAVTWIDSKPVHMVSTTPQPPDGNIEVKWRKDGVQQVIPCPFVIQEYNSYMGGVDKKDQLKIIWNSCEFQKVVAKNILWSCGQMHHQCIHSGMWITHPHKASTQAFLCWPG